MVIEKCKKIEPVVVKFKNKIYHFFLKTVYYGYVHTCVHKERNINS